MKETLNYLVIKMAVAVYEKSIVKAGSSDKVLDIISGMNEVARELMDDKNLKIQKLGRRIILVNLKALSGMCGYMIKES